MGRLFNIVDVEIFFGNILQCVIINFFGILKNIFECLAKLLFPCFPFNFSGLKSKFFLMKKCWTKQKNYFQKKRKGVKTSFDTFFDLLPFDHSTLLAILLSDISCSQ